MRKKKLEMALIQKTLSSITIVGIIAVLFYFVARAVFSGQKPLMPVKITNLVVSKTPVSENPIMINSLALEDTVNRAMVGANGHYAVVIKNLKTKEEYSVNEHEKFPSASLYKLWVMAAVFDAIKEGSLNLETKLSRDISDLNDEFDVDPEEAELTDGSITMTTATALEQMIVISHNYAAMMLTSKVGLASISGKMKQIGLTESSLGSPPMTTAADVELFFEKLYRARFTDSANTKKMAELLSRQQKNLGIPKYLPSGIMVAHKTGEIGTYKHDGGIVSTPNNDYVFVVMSQSNFPDGAQERIALISKVVFDYFEAQ